MTAGSDNSSAGMTADEFADRLAAGLAKQYGSQPGRAEAAADDMAYLIRKIERAADEAEPNTRRANVTRALAKIFRMAAAKMPTKTPDLLRVLAHVSPTATLPALSRDS